jgi:transcriptional regulator with XRE-family HTH domain
MTNIISNAVGQPLLDHDSVKMLPSNLEFFSKDINTDVFLFQSTLDNLIGSDNISSRQHTYVYITNCEVCQGENSKIVKEVVEILKRVKQAKNIKTDADLAKFLHVKQNTLSMWKSRNKMPYKLLITMCEKENINLSWLFTGRGEMFIQPDRVREEKPIYTASPTVEKILIMLEGMTPEEQEEMLKYLKKEELIKKLLEEHTAKNKKNNLQK